MRYKLLHLILIFSGIYLNAQTWTKEQLAKANTAQKITYLTTVEKEAIMYINLARLFPKEFAKFETIDYNGDKKYGDYLKNSKYKNSLITTLNTMASVEPLAFDKTLYENAKCFAKESGELGIEGHKRVKCTKGNYAECCSYGMETGKDIALQWLIDDGITSLGHRKNCLEKRFIKIGLSCAKHKKWDTCAVAEFTDEE